jgi:hypothetical protein
VMVQTRLDIKRGSRSISSDANDDIEAARPGEREREREKER